MPLNGLPRTLSAMEFQKETKNTKNPAKNKKFSEKLNHQLAKKRILSSDTM